MKISDLVALLQRSIQTIGDLEVVHVDVQVAQTAPEKNETGRRDREVVRLTIG